MGSWGRVEGGRVRAERVGDHLISEMQWDIYGHLDARVPLAAESWARDFNSLKSPQVARGSAKLGEYIDGR